MATGRNTQGFTLTELIVSVAIVGMISAMVIANFNRGKYNDDLRRSTQQFLENLRRVQNHAMTGQFIGAIFSKGGYGAHLAYVNPAVTPPGTQQYFLYGDVRRIQGGVCVDWTDVDMPDSVYTYAVFPVACQDIPVDTGTFGLGTGVIISNIRIGATNVLPGTVDIAFRPPKPTPVVNGLEGQTVSVEFLQTKTNQFRTVTVIGPSGQINEQAGALP